LAGGVVEIGHATAPWEAYLAFLFMGIGWAGHRRHDVAMLAQHLLIVIAATLVCVLAFAADASTP
jgi:hypothetical protein